MNIFQQIDFSRDTLKTLKALEINTIADAEEKQLGLISLTKEIVTISKRIFRHTNAIEKATSLVRLLREHDEDDLAKDLEISIAYLVNDQEKAA
jgi:hypothetical protein